MTDIDQIVSSFANRLTALLQHEMQVALSHGAMSAPTTRSNGKTTTKRGKGEKRPKAELEAIKAKLLRVIKDNDGKRIEELKAVIGLETKDLMLPIRQLIAKKLIKTHGRRRGTRYHAKGAPRG